MPSFIYNGAPRSYQAKNLAKYERSIRDVFSKLPNPPALETGELFGFVYYFNAKPNTIDADNISKPVWDSLKGLAYGDDSQIMIRYAGRLAINKIAAIQLDITNMPDEITDDYVNALKSNSDFLYIEWGKFNPNLFCFGGTKK